MFDAKSEKLGAFAGNDAVEEKLDEVERSRLCANVAGESYFLARNGDESAVGIRFLGQNVQTTLEK